jgi:ankyrin repeat protein
VKYAGKYRKNAAIHPCRVSYHAGLGDAHGLLWHLEDDITQVNRPQRFDGQELPLIVIAAKYCPAESIISVFDVLRSKGAQINVHDRRDSNALHWICENGSLLRRSATVRETSAAEDYLPKAVKWLAEWVDVNAKDRYGRTPLSWMVEKEASQGVRALLSVGADPNIADNYGYTPLHRILNFEYNNQYSEEDTQIVVALLEHEADPNLPTSKEARWPNMYFPNALFIAIHRNWPQGIIQLLIEKDADTSAVTQEGSDALGYAISRGNVGLVRFLREESPSARSLEDAHDFLRVNGNTDSDSILRL